MFKRSVFFSLQSLMIQYLFVCVHLFASKRSLSVLESYVCWSIPFLFQGINSILSFWDIHDPLKCSCIYYFHGSISARKKFQPNHKKNSLDWKSFLPWHLPSCFSPSVSPFKTRKHLFRHLAHVRMMEFQCERSLSQRPCLSVCCPTLVS